MKFKVFTLLALLMLLGLTACGEKATPEPTKAATPTVVAPEPTATVEPTQEPVATFEEAPCPFDVPEDAAVECGFVVVPEDHNDPAGPTIRLAAAILKDQSDEHQPDPVILLAGGPGEKTVANALALGAALAPIHPNRDLIIFDQRGVGLSESALECPEFVDVLFQVIDRLNTEPIPITVTNPLDGQTYDALLTGDAVFGNLVTFLYVTDIIPVLPQAIFDVYNGDYELL